MVSFKAAMLHWSPGMSFVFVFAATGSVQRELSGAVLGAVVLDVTVLSGSVSH